MQYFFWLEVFFFHISTMLSVLNAVLYSAPSRKKPHTSFCPLRLSPRKLLCFIVPRALRKKHRKTPEFRFLKRNIGTTLKLHFGSFVPFDLDPSELLLLEER